MRLAILCSGQAGQHVRMLDDILAAPDCSGLRAVASAVLQQDVVTWWRGLSEAQLFANANAQFAIALYQIATWSRIAPLVPAPIVVAGYSLGEVISWHVAAALDAESTLRLVRARAALMDLHAPTESTDGCMVLWRGRNAPAVRAACHQTLLAHGLAPAIYRPGGELVLAGPADRVSAFLAEPAVRDAASFKRLQVSVPAHSAWLQDAARPFREAVRTAHPADPGIPVLGGIDGRVLRQGADAAEYLSAQLVRPVRWDWCQDTLMSLKVDVALELGPGTDLVKMLRECEGISARAAEEFASQDSLVSWLANRQ